MQKEPNIIFEQAIQNLNAAQRNAVERIDGPVLVLAGPGTGKTQTLALRIGNILLKTDALPENILCLTFTDAAVNAMRTRLAELIGTTAHKVQINTFHSFCNEVIKENPSYFNSHELDALSDIEHIQLLREIIDSFDKDHPLKRWKTSKYFDLRNFKILFQNIQKEHWNPLQIEAEVKNTLDLLLQNEEYVYKRNSGTNKKGDPNKKYFEEKERLERTAIAALEYNKYVEKKRTIHRYDFNDMILWVLDAFKKHPDLLAYYQEKYQFVLVDEYQDTNGSQNELVDLLSSYWETPNLFVVGDDDQSIFRFQGANMENIQHFYEKYISACFDIEEQKDRVVVLTENYRSSQHIINTSDALININTERLVKKLPQLQLNKKLVAKGKYSAFQIKPAVLEFTQTAAEHIAIKNYILEKQKAGIPLHEIAVLYRNHAQVDALVKYLKNEKISLHIIRSEDVLESGIVKLVLEILYYIQEEIKLPYSAENRFFQILRHPFSGVSAGAISAFFLLYRKEKHERKEISIRQILDADILQKHEAVFEIYKTDFEKIKNLHHTLENLVKDAPWHTLQSFVEQVFQRLHILSFILEQEENANDLERIKTLYDFIKEERNKNAQLGIASFLEMVELMREENELSLPLMPIVKSPNAVQFISVHKSKGLEFDCVWVLGCDKNTWNKKSKSDYFRIPETLYSKEIQSDNFEEERRLLFVAITRAKKEITISYATQSNDGKLLEPSVFIQELKQYADIDFQKQELNEQEIPRYTITQMLPELGSEYIISDAYLDEILKNYSLSVTHLDAYLECPKGFYYKHILRIPAAMSPSMAFGSAIHHVLEWLGKAENPTEIEAVFVFEQAMKRAEAQFTLAQFKEYLELGKTYIPLYFSELLPKWNYPSKHEIKIETTIQNIPVNGKIDKLEEVENALRIIDFKTGKHSKKKVAPPVENLEEKDADDVAKKYGTNYWRQGVFYQLLLENHPDYSAKLVENSVFVFVEPDDENTFQQEKVPVLPAYKEMVLEQIVSSYQKIQQKEFTGCGKEDCAWCNTNPTKKKYF